MTNNCIKQIIHFTCCIGLTFIFFATAFAAEPHVFRTGLVLPQCHNYGRTAEYTDQLAYLLGNGKLQRPVANAAVFSLRGEPVSWTEINADDGPPAEYRLAQIYAVPATFSARPMNDETRHLFSNEMNSASRLRMIK